MKKLTLKSSIISISILLSVNVLADELGNGDRNSFNSGVSSSNQERSVSQPDCGLPSLNIPPSTIESATFFVNEQNSNSKLSPELCEKEYDMNDKEPYIKPKSDHLSNLNLVVDTIEACEYRPYEKKRLSKKLLQIIDKAGSVKSGTGYHMSGNAISCLVKIHENSQNCELANKLLDATHYGPTSLELMHSGGISTALDAIKKINCSSDDFINRIIENSAKDAHFVYAIFYNTYLTQDHVSERIQSGRSSTFESSIQKFCGSNT